MIMSKSYDFLIQKEIIEEGIITVNAETKEDAEEILKDFCKYGDSRTEYRFGDEDGNYPDEIEFDDTLDFKSKKMNVIKSYD